MNQHHLKIIKKSKIKFKLCSVAWPRCDRLERILDLSCDLTKKKAAYGKESSEIYFCLDLS